MHENNSKYLRSKYFSGAIRALYSKVTIGSLSITSKIYLNLFQKLLLLKKVSENGSKLLKSNSILRTSS